MSSFSISEQNKIKRSPNRGQYGHDAIYNILDAGFVCQVGFIDKNNPVVIPMTYGRSDNTIYLHGASTSRIMNLLPIGNSVCISVTHIDGIVVARSMFDTSVNYRSVVLFGKAEVIQDEEKSEALWHISEHILPGRWQEVRPPSVMELKATTILKVTIEHASAKVRTGPPDDDVRDLDLPVWAGVIPLKLVADTPVDDPALRYNYEISPSVLTTIKKF